jgi:N-acetylmuramoyl-L-alanine amidase
MALLLRRLSLILILPLLVGSCSTVFRENWVPSPNFSDRKPNFVIIHQTDSVNHARALDTLTNPIKKVSAHYLIAKNGKTTQLVEEGKRAWHAGKSYWGGQTDMNSASIGIELDHKGDEVFEQTQIEALISLLRGISERHGIPRANYLGHGDIALGRKVDPNHLFPWKRLAENGFGLWCSDEEVLMSTNNADPVLGLQALGYDISQPEKAAQAFRRHFRGKNDGAQLDANDLQTLSCLLKKKTLPPASNTSNGAVRRPFNDE